MPKKENLYYSGEPSNRANYMQVKATPKLLQAIL